jgi:hypothetical protein
VGGIAPLQPTRRWRTIRAARFDAIRTLSRSAAARNFFRLKSATEGTNMRAAERHSSPTLAAAGLYRQPVSPLPSASNCGGWQRRRAGSRACRAESARASQNTEDRRSVWGRSLDRSAHQPAAQRCGIVHVETSQRNCPGMTSFGGLSFGLLPALHGNILRHRGVPIGKRDFLGPVNSL